MPKGMLRQSSHDRDESPHDRHETRNDERLATVLRVEFLGTVEVLLLEEQGVVAGEQARPGSSADPVAQGVADDGCHGEDGSQEVDVESELRLR